MKKITQNAEQDGFHGCKVIPITGENWRKWNEITVAVDMDEEDRQAMYNGASCHRQGNTDCKCGGYFVAQLADDPANDTQIHLVPREWITNPEILATI